MKEEKPSQVTEEYWVHAISKSKKKYPEPTKNCGKWMIFAYKGEQLDKIWEGVRKAIEKGLLGSSAKCSTAKENPNSANIKTGIICIYTYDSNDKEDLKKIARGLFKIGNIKRLLYKEDVVTYEGKYRNKGHKKISKWVVTKENFEEVLK